MQPPNILLFLTDDHAQWALGCSGNGEIETPNLDFLAGRGVQFDNAFTPTPVCSPARACLHTGRLASQHGIHDYLASGAPEINAHDWLGEELTLAQLLREGAGYQTAQSGKWHLGQDEEPQAGYDQWFTMGRRYPIYHHGPVDYGFDGRHETIPGRPTHVIAEKGLDMMRRFEPERPFFLSVGLYATHSPWTGQAERRVERYRRATFADIPQDESYPFGRQNLESTDPTRENPREALAQYYAAVNEIDEAVGRLLDELDALGRLENTLVIYTSDHGLNCGHHGIWGKGNGTLPLNMVEESIRVPLIFWQPGLLFGPQRRGEFVDHLDLFQTILAAAGVEAPAGRSYPGRSFWPFLRNEPLSGWRTAQFGEYGPLRMVRTTTHKLVRRDPEGPHELFDLVGDPRETRNLFADPDQQERVARLTEMIAEYFGRHEDPHKTGRRAAELPRHNFSEAWRE